MEWLSVRKPLSVEDVIAVEKELEINLPIDYVEQIGPLNGGALRDAVVFVPGTGNVSYSRNVSLHKNPVLSVYDLVEAFNTAHIRLFPFGSVGNGDYFCFDLEKNKVVLRMHETEEIVPVCDTFTQLLEKITIR